MSLAACANGADIPPAPDERDDLDAGIEADVYPDMTDVRTDAGGPRGTRLCMAGPTWESHDSDGDGIGDACDNCPGAVNGKQRDSDLDGLGDVCDVCPTLREVNQTDADRDGVGDACDNCPAISNSGQEDANANGRGDRCDDAPIPVDKRCGSGRATAAVLDTNLQFLVDNSASMQDAACSYDSNTCSCGPRRGRFDDDCVDDGRNRRVPSRERAWEQALLTLAPMLASGPFNLATATFTAPFETDANSAVCRSVLNQTMAMQAQGTASDAAFAEAFRRSAQVTPGDYTPTAAALLSTLDPNRDGDYADALFRLPNDPNDQQREKAVVLVTDGLPTTCPGEQGWESTSPDEMNAALLAARKVAASGVKVFVIGFEIGEQQRFQLLANAGDPQNPGPHAYCAAENAVLPCICRTVNRQAGCTAVDNLTNSPWYPVRNTDSIVQAVNEIVATTMSCTFPLDIQDGADEQTLRLWLIDGSSRTLVPVAEYHHENNKVVLEPASCDGFREIISRNPRAYLEAEMACACVPQLEACDDLVDNDCDGLVDEDCDQSIACVPSKETCGDSVDNDCDGETDEDCSEYILW